MSFRAEIRKLAEVTSCGRAFRSAAVVNVEACSAIIPWPSDRSAEAVSVTVKNVSNILARIWASGKSSPRIKCVVS